MVPHQSAVQDGQKYQLVVVKARVVTLSCMLVLCYNLQALSPHGLYGVHLQGGGGGPRHFQVPSHLLAHTPHRHQVHLAHDNMTTCDIMLCDNFSHDFMLKY